METQHRQIHKEGEEEEKEDKEEGKGDVQVARQQQAQLSPPSASSSPGHEFTFTISLHPTACTKPPPPPPPPPPPNGDDLSPADDIFFHGHLLPLHLVSHITPPRSSTNSLDSLQIKHLHKQENNDKTSANDDHVVKGRAKTKSKSFLLSKPKWMTSRPKVGGREEEEENKNTHHDHHHHTIKTRNKSKFEFVKRCMRLVKPFFHSFRKEGDYRPGKFREKFSSYSGNLRVKSGGVGGSNKLMKGRRAEISAPASMRGSPTNSGRLVAASGSLTPTTSSDSTMEELQAAIQAAIAHCKKSIATPEDRVKTESSRLGSA